MTDKSPAPRLSVVSVNYGTLDYLRACLRALAHSTLQPEFIVVDNDGSAAPLAREFPHIRLLPQAQNRFFCGGNNVGIRASQAGGIQEEHYSQGHQEKSTKDAI